MGIGCRQAAVPSGKAKTLPAKVSNGGVKEADLATITLSEDAERRLGIETVAAQATSGGRTGTWAGEVVIPPGQAIVVSAPVAGTVSFAGSGFLPVPGARLKRNDVLLHLKPLLAVERDLRVSLESEARAAETRVDAARTRFERAERMLKEQTGSAKAKEATEEELTLAQTAQAAARARLQRLDQTPLDSGLRAAIAVPKDGLLKTVHVAEGQMVAGGAPLFELEQLETLWIRVAVYAGEIDSLARDSSASVRALNAGPNSPMRQAAPVLAPPSADPAASTVDLYFALSNHDLALRPGQKVGVTLPLRGEARGLTIPSAAVLYDIHGGAWVYQQTAPQKYSRRRVEVARVAGGAALVTRGLQPGAKVVTAGAAELFGTEFSTGK
jgi:RND family efflux transporter MFP subunit